MANQVGQDVGHYGVGCERRTKELKRHGVRRYRYPGADGAAR
jgi:hypothetical protein